MSEIDTYDKQHVPGCRKLVYDPKSSPCSCVNEWERLCGEVRITEHDAERYRREAEDLREVAQDLHRFQLLYETNAYEPGRMPGNELYSGKLMSIVGAARRALMKHGRTLEEVVFAPVMASEASATLQSAAQKNTNKSGSPGREEGAERT